MKAFVIPVISVIMLLFISCSKDDGSPTLPEPEQIDSSGSLKFMEITKEYYDRSAIRIDSHLIFYTENRWKAIKIVSDSALNEYRRYVYDSQGRLSRVEWQRTGNSGTVLFERPAANVFVVVNGNQSDTFTVNTLQGGSRMIVKTSNDDLNDTREHFYFNEFSMIVKKELSYDLNEPGSFYKVHHYNYSSFNKLELIRDTTDHLQSYPTSALAIQKDTAENEFLLNYFRKLNGTDMEWLNQTDGVWGAPFRLFGAIIPDYLFLLSGTVTSVNLTMTYSDDGVIFLPNPNSPINYTMQVQYDNKRRIISCESFRNGSKLEAVKIRYFD